MKQKPKIIVIGSGIVGASIAMSCLDLGADVVVLERDNLGGSASSKSFGWINASFAESTDYFKLRNAAVDKFRNLNENGIFYGPHIERIAAVYRNIFQEASNQMVVNFNQNNNIQKSFEIREKLNSLIPNNIVPEMEQMITYRTWEYYEIAGGAPAQFV